MTSAQRRATSESPSTAVAILDATLLVIGERGLKGTTTRAIAERAEVNEVTLFRKFGTKANLIRAAIEHRFATARRDFVAYTGSIDADLIRLATNYRDTLEEFGPAIRAIVTEAPYEPELAGSLQGAQRLYDAIAAMLARYQQEGVLRPEPAETLVPAFLAPILVPYLTRMAEPLGVPHFVIDPTVHVHRFLSGRSLQSEP